MDVGILTTTLTKFLWTITGGYGALHPHATWLLRTLALIDLVLVALGWMFGRGAMAAHAFQKLLLYTVFIGLVANWGELVKLVADACISLGLLGGGSTMTLTEFSNPSTVAALGLVATEPLFAPMREWAAVLHVGTAIMSGLCGLAILLAFLYIAVTVFVQFIEFYVIAVLASVLVPFGVWTHTAFLAEQMFATILGHGLRFMVLSFLTSLAFPALQAMRLGPDPAFGAVIALGVGVWALAALIFKSDRLLSGMLARSPALTAGIFAGTAWGGALMAGAIGGGMLRGGARVSKAFQAGTRVPQERE